MKEHILFVTTLLPYPLDNGGKIKTYNTLKILAEEYYIDLVCFYEEESEKENIGILNKLCTTVTCYKGKIITSNNKTYMCKLALKSIFSKLPLTIMKFQNRDFTNFINYKLANKKYKYIHIDHLQVAINVNRNNNKQTQIILDEHNCEYLIMKRKYFEESNILKKIFFGYEYLKLKNYEKSIINRSNKIITLSDKDKATLNELCGKSLPIEVIPIPIEATFSKKNVNSELEKVKLLFLGTMSWMPNYEGIVWFLNNVVNKMRKNDIPFELYIVGKNPGNDIVKYHNNKDIIVTGYVEDVDEYIERCDFVVVPIFFGSGLRVKILEALAKSIPVISTDIGAEGLQVTNNKDILLANNEEEFIDAINKLKKASMREYISTNGKNLFDEKYSFEAIKIRLLNLLDEEWLSE